jgi:hypothetical protein
VAARAGVSIGTVSHVISGRQHVAPQTRQRVEDAMAALGYRPNRIARSLILQHTRTLGMVIPDVANPFFGDLMRGVEVARERGYSVLFGAPTTTGTRRTIRRRVHRTPGRQSSSSWLLIAGVAERRRRAAEGAQRTASAGQFRARRRHEQPGPPGRCAGRSAVVALDRLPTTGPMTR